MAFASHLLARVDTVSLGYKCTEHASTDHASTDHATHVVLVNHESQGDRQGHSIFKRGSLRRGCSRLPCVQLAPPRESSIAAKRGRCGPDRSVAVHAAGS